MIYKTIAEINASLTALPPVGSRWQHYRTGTIYWVVAHGIDEETLEPLVGYQQLEDKQLAAPWFRKLSQWQKPLCLMASKCHGLLRSVHDYS